MKIECNLESLFPGGYAEAVLQSTQFATLNSKCAELYTRVAELEAFISSGTTVTRTVYTDRFGDVLNATETTVTKGGAK